MGAGAGFALKIIQWFNRGVEFCCAGLILSLTSYFLAAMSDHNITIPTNLRATEGISGVGVLYTGIGVLLVCCLAGFTLTSFLAIVLDIAFVGAFIYVATVYKHGASSCSGTNVQTVFGSGDAESKVSSTSDGSVPLPTYRTACKMESAMLAVAIVAIVFFIISALTELGLGRHRKKEQRFGPSPANNYTSGYGRGGFGRLFRRNRNTVDTADANGLPAHTTPDQIRQSHQTEETYIGAGGDSVSHSYPKYGEAGYNEHGMPATNGVSTNGATTNHYQYGNTTTTAANNTTNTAAPAYGASYRYGDGTYNA